LETNFKTRFIDPPVTLDLVRTTPEYLYQDHIDDIDEKMWSPLVYIAGYAAYAEIKKTKCDYCKVYLIQEEDC